MENLQRMKKATKEWANSKKLREEEELRKVNEELDFLEKPEGAGYSSLESRNKIRELESTRKNILQLREESWCLKSRAI